MGRMGTARGDGERRTRRRDPRSTRRRRPISDVGDDIRAAPRAGPARMPADAARGRWTRAPLTIAEARARTAECAESDGYRGDPAVVIALNCGSIDGVACRRRAPPRPPLPRGLEPRRRANDDVRCALTRAAAERRARSGVSVTVGTAGAPRGRVSRRGRLARVAKKASVPPPRAAFARAAAEAEARRARGHHAIADRAVASPFIAALVDDPATNSEVERPLRRQHHPGVDVPEDASARPRCESPAQERHRPDLPRRRRWARRGWTRDGRGRSIHDGRGDSTRGHAASSRRGEISQPGGRRAAPPRRRSRDVATVG